DLAGIEANGPGQLLLGQLAHRAVGQQVLKRRRHQIGRLRRRAGKLDRVVLLVRMNNAAEVTHVGHGRLLLVRLAIVRCIVGGRATWQRPKREKAPWRRGSGQRGGQPVLRRKSELTASSSVCESTGQTRWGVSSLKQTSDEQRF